MSALLLLATGLTAYAGCLLLAMSQNRFRTDILPGAAANHRLNRSLRCAGTALLALSAALAIARDGAAFGCLLFVQIVCLGALLVVPTLAFWRSDRKPSSQHRS